MTFNQVVAGSIPACLIPEREICGCGGIGRRARFRLWCHRDVRVQVSPSAFRRPFAGVFTQSLMGVLVSSAENGHFIIVLYFEP